MPDPKVWALIQAAFALLTFVVGLMIQNQVSKLRADILEELAEVKDWVLSHFITREACDQHRAGR